MRIAVIGSRGYPCVYSGYETFVKELSERLVKRGIGVTVYNHRRLFKKRPPVVNGIRLVYIPTMERKTLSQFVHSVQAVLHACLRRYDVILVVNSANGPLGLFTRIFRLKTAINVDGLEWLRPKWKGVGAKYFYWASRAATKLYDIVIADSREMQTIYRKEFGCESVVIAYGAAMCESKNPAAIGRWGLTERGYYLVVGRLIPDNNADLIVREFLTSSSSRRLVIVGDVPYKDHYARTIKAIRDPRLVFAGYVRDQEALAELYHHCYAYFHGHEFGGTNPALLQALGCGCVVCALDTVFNREVLKNGEYGFFFSKKRSNLRQAIQRIEANPIVLEELRKKAVRRILENYTWDKITGQYIRLFRELKEKRRISGADEKTA
jgi:glycosyltransferase involved in cell wall biosynthesis